MRLKTADSSKVSKLSQRLMWIIWPSFLMAGVLEVLVFSMVDPHDLHWFGQSVMLSRQGIYTLAFFAFWLVTLLSSALSIFLAIPSTEVNSIDIRKIV